MQFLLSFIVIVLFLVVLVSIVGFIIMLSAKIIQSIFGLTNSLFRRPRVEKSEIVSLYSKMKKARKKEDYEKASKIQKELDSLIR